MSEQLAIDFDARKHARRRDPATSKAAARDAERWVMTQAGRVYAALKALGPAGKTRIAARAGLSDVQVARRLAVRVARAELPHDGLDETLQLYPLTEQAAP